MNREIKFRAYIKLEEWEGYYYPNDENDYIQFVLFQDGFSVVDCNDNYLKDDEYIIEQFTGLTDKNGKDIYEGDIVDHCLGFAKIVFKHGEFRIIGITADIYNRMYHELIDATIPNMEGSRFDGVTTRLEIIGKIHEENK